MLKIPYVLKESEIHGTGLFAVGDIPAGTVVWKYVEGIDRTVTFEEFDRLCPEAREFIMNFAYSPHGSTVWMVDGDGAMYVNHSPDPNLRDPDPHTTVAVRDIAAGEELTIDYRCFCQFAYLEPYCRR